MNLFFPWFSIVFYLILMFGGSSTSTNIECSFGDNYYFVLGLVYRCSVHNNPNITTGESAQISGIRGTHKSLKGNDDVIGFYGVYETINFFPKGLEKFFKNIKVINIQECQLKEIHQSDLKVFPNLVYLYLHGNEIEVIEEGLFDFNPNLEFVGFRESKIIHIDPNVFDHLTKLSYFWFGYVPCVKQDTANSIEKVQEAIKIVKSNCSSSYFLSLENQMKNLEIESKTLNSEDFNTKLENFEKILNNSKFSKFRPLNYKFQDLKLKTDRAKNTLPLGTNGTKLSDDLENITDKFDDLKLSQLDLTFKCSQNDTVAAIRELKLSQDTLRESQKDLNSKLTGISLHGAKFDEILKSQSQFNVNMTNILNDKFNQIEQSQNNLKTSLDSLKSSQDSLKNSLDFSLINLTSKFSDLKKDIKSSQDDTKLSINDIEVKLSDQKSFQNDVKDALVKVRTMQNEIKMTLNDVRNSKNEGFEDKLMDFGQKLEGKLSEKVESLEGHFVDFKVENSDKLGKIEKELTSKLHKMSTSFDEKIKGIEKRLMKKFEEILEEKLVKIFDEKLGNLIDAKAGTQ